MASSIRIQYVIVNAICNRLIATIFMQNATPFRHSDATTGIFLPDLQCTLPPYVQELIRVHANNSAIATEICREPGWTATGYGRISLGLTIQSVPGDFFPEGKAAGA
jgi:hypothetical protein